MCTSSQEADELLSGMATLAGVGIHRGFCDYQAGVDVKSGGVGAGSSCGRLLGIGPVAGLIQLPSSTHLKKVG